MKVAAYQAPLFCPGCMDGIESMRRQIRQWEKEGIGIPCARKGLWSARHDR